MADARDEYARMHKKLEGQWLLLQNELEAHRTATAQPDWCDIGDLNHIDEILGQALEYVRYVNAC